MDNANESRSPYFVSCFYQERERGGICKAVIDKVSFIHLNIYELHFLSDVTETF